MLKKQMKDIKKVVDNNRFLLQHAFRTVPMYVFFVCTLPASHVILQFFEFRYMPKVMIDSIQFSRPVSYAIGYLAAVFIAASLYIFAANLFGSMLKKKAQAKLYKHLQLTIYQKASSMDLECYDNPDFYTDFVWAMNEVTKRTDAVLETIALFGASVALILSSGIFMLFYDVFGIIFVATSFILTYFANIFINKLRFELDVAMNPIQRKRDYISRVFYLNDFSKEIRLNDIKNKLYKDFKASNDELVDTVKKRTNKITFFSFLANYVFNTFIINGLYIVYVMFKILVLKAFSYGTAFALIQTSWGLKQGLNQFSQVFPQFLQHSLYIEKLKKFIDYESKVVNHENAISMPENLCTIEFKNVGFSYNNGEKPILKNINLTIRPYEKIAFVGHNGAGKTTLTKLFMRLYDVTEGEILYNGVNIKEYDIEQYRNHFGSVFQDYQLFAASIAENVMMDQIPCNDNDIVEALNGSGFTEKLATLPKGIHTRLTREFDDDGIDLSGGEAQKVAIARVLFKNSNIIILDEPSSALDPISEYHLNETITKAAYHKTVIFISHRLSTTRIADRIYMLDNCEIIEEGSHDELMKRNGKYAFMFNLQAEKYRIEDSIKEDDFQIV